MLLPMLLMLGANILSIYTHNKFAITRHKVMLAFIFKNISPPALLAVYCIIAMNFNRIKICINKHPSTFYFVKILIITKIKL